MRIGVNAQWHYFSSGWGLVDAKSKDHGFGKLSEDRKVGIVVDLLI